MEAPVATTASDEDSSNAAAAVETYLAEERENDETPTNDGAEDGQTANDDGANDDEFKNAIALEELAYGVDSFNAIVKPVFLTMTLSAIAVTFFTTQAFREQTQATISNSYNVYGNASEASTTSQQLGQGLVNALVIVSVLCGVTFVIVILYKYRCMMLLLGYMILASAMLLGYLSAVMLQVAIQRYQIPVDLVTFWTFLYNFAIVGTMSIFFGGEKGLRIPMYITQAYLILSSVIVAWQLSNFDEWTGWLLLVLLALYDLFAVLTPCGPLKALVKLMQREDAPAMPGLLYEASLNNTGQQRSRTMPRSASTRVAARSVPEVDSDSANVTLGMGDRADTPIAQAPATVNPETTAASPPVTTASSLMTGQVETSLSSDQNTDVVIDDTAEYSAFMCRTDTTVPGDDEELPPPTAPTSLSEQEQAITVSAQTSEAEPATTHPASRSLRPNLTIDTGVPPANGTMDTTGNDDTTPPRQPTRGNIPLAIALRYRLALVHPLPDWMTVAQGRRQRAGTDGSSERGGGEQAYELFFTPQELQSLVSVQFPSGGGMVLEHETENADDANNQSNDNPSSDAAARRRRWWQRGGSTESTADEPEPDLSAFPRFAVYDRDGTLRRVLFVNSEGHIYQDNRAENERRRRENGDDESARGAYRDSIKLGLGDFIFYSILVSKAALYSFTTFWVCTVVILTGLGLTLLLLAFYRQALPALPISIFLGVLFYLLTRYVIEPWIHAVFTNQVFV